MDEAARIAGAYWGIDRSSTRSAHWIEHPTTRAILQRRISGDPTVSAVEWFQRTFVPTPLPFGLSLGSGFGAFERNCIQLGIAERLDAYDVSPGAIERARAEAAKCGLADRINYAVADLNGIELAAGRYDVIVAVASVHHVFQLEHLFHECRKALKPGGLLYLDEYIGPSRFQLSREATIIINRFLAVLPPRYRKNLFTGDGALIESFAPAPIEWFEQNDPSESPRSGEIVNVLKLYFNIVECRPYGGGIMHMLLSGIAGNFDETDERDVAMLRILAATEQSLEESGLIASDLAVVVARPRPI